MAEVENETRQLKKKEFFPYKIMGTLIFSLLLSIVIEWGAWIYHYLRDYIESVLYVIITFIIRLMIIVLISPLFLLVALVGGGDGLVQRDLRRFGVGRESVFKYHHAKRVVFPVMLLAWGLYLSIPFSIHPNWILIPSAIFFGLTISFTASSFKKYLWSEMSYLYFKALQA